MEVFRIFDTFTEEETTNLTAMRSWIATIELPDQTLTSAGKLDLIHAQITQELVGRHDNWKLAALGILFGDALHQAFEGRLRWVLVQDSAGLSPALRWKRTEVLIYPVSALRERVQSDELLDIYTMFSEYIDLLPFKTR